MAYYMDEQLLVDTGPDPQRNRMTCSNHPKRTCQNRAASNSLQRRSDPPGHGWVNSETEGSWLSWLSWSAVRRSRVALWSLFWCWNNFIRASSI